MKKSYLALSCALLFVLSAFGACAPANPQGSGGEGGGGGGSEVCSHPADQLEYRPLSEPDDSKHEIYCNLCSTVIGTEPHDFDMATGACKACHYVAETVDPDLDDKNYYVVGTVGDTDWNHLDEAYRFTRSNRADADGLTVFTLDLEIAFGAEFKVVNDGTGTTPDEAGYWNGTEMGKSYVKAGDAAGDFTSGGHDNITLSGEEGMYTVTLHTSPKNMSASYIAIDRFDDQHEHVFSEEWTYNAFYHWHEATCGHHVTSEQISHSYNENLVCRDCGYISEDSPLHEHSFAAAWSRDQDYHWHAATCSHVNEKQAYDRHSFGADGACSVCHYRPLDVGADNYDTYYEIFVYSYCDSDGDSIGDLKGITSQLDYIADMGYTGIWLTPIHPSHSANHKYSVDDYYDVDASFGTLADFDELVETAHGLGIKIILDMVFNHTSSYNEWFTEGADAFRRGDTENKYYDYYNFSNSPQNGYRNYGGVYAEAWFDDNMPDLNLSNPDVKDELSNVMKFWLVNHDVDGFRLDAAKHYFGPSNSPYHEQSAEFVKWINETAKSYKENAYVVAEVWEGEGTIRNYYNWSGSDSFFYFPTSTGGSGEIASAVTAAMGGNASSAASRFYSSMTNAISNAVGHIPAPFLDNHDVNRIADKLGRNADRIKFAYGLLSLYTGTTFTYYGDEIGMIGTRTASNTDAERRYAMLWDATSKPTITVDGYPNSYAFDGVVQQLQDTASILNYYKACNLMRKNNPVLVRGTPTRISASSDDVLIFDKVYEGVKVRVVVNFASSAKSVQISGSLSGYATLDGSAVTVSGQNVTLPAYGIAVFS